MVAFRRAREMSKVSGSEYAPGSRPVDPRAMITMRSAGISTPSTTESAWVIRWVNWIGGS